MFAVRRMGVLAGVLVAGVLPLGTLAAGCGGDDNGNVGTSDASPDVTVDATHDAPATDTSTTPDTSTDGGKDAAPDSTVDAGADASDADADASADADAADAPFDANAIFGFPLQVAQAICGRFAACCQTVDAASPTEHFDMDTCIGQYLNFGYAGSTTGEAVVEGGHVAFDPNQAASCLNQIAAIDCTVDLRSSTQERNIISACFGALTGTLDAGAPCRASLECAPGEFCDPLGDGGGNCEPLRGDGGNCGDFGTSAFQTASQMCSYRGSGNTGLTCQYGNFSTFATFADAAAWACVPQEGADASCFSNDNCQSMLCDPGPSFNIYRCEGAETFIYGFACQTFIVDGGGD
jgi:hypothetical protein